MEFGLGISRKIIHFLISSTVELYVSSSSENSFSVHAGGMNVARFWQRISFLICKMELWTCEFCFHSLFCDAFLNNMFISWYHVGTEALE